MALLQYVTSIVWELRRSAPPEARLMGDLAAAVGVLAVVSAGRYLLSYRRDRSRMRSAQTSGAVPDFPAGGPLAEALGQVWANNRVLSHLSGDAVLALVRSRLEAYAEGRAAKLRFLAYAPLLLGLSGTMFGLARLLPELDFRRTEPQIQRTARTAESAPPVGRSQLEGVFVGTLMGIFGSMAAAAGATAFGAVSARVSGEAEQFLLVVVLPHVPDPRVRLDVQEDVVRALSESTRKAVELFVTELRRVVVPLQATATQSAEAAKTATAAFGEAQRALKEAGNLEKASRNLNAGLKTMANAAGVIDAVTASLDRLAKDQADVEGKMTQTAGEMLVASQQLSGALGAWSSALTDEAARREQSTRDLTLKITELGDQVRGVGQAFGGLATDVHARNELETGKLEESRREIERFAQAVTSSSARSSDVAQELAMMRQTQERFSEVAVKAISSGLTEQIRTLCVQIEESFNKVASVLPRAADEVRAAGKELLRDVESARRGLPEVSDRLLRLTDVLKEQTEALHKLAERASHTRSFDLSAPLWAGGSTPIETRARPAAPLVVGPDRPRAPTPAASVTAARPRSGTVPRHAEPAQRRRWYWPFGGGYWPFRGWY